MIGKHSCAYSLGKLRVTRVPRTDYHCRTVFPSERHCILYPDTNITHAWNGNILQPRTDMEPRCYCLIWIQEFCYQIYSLGVENHGAEVFILRYPPLYIYGSGCVHVVSYRVQSTEYTCHITVLSSIILKEKCITFFLINTHCSYGFFPSLINTHSGLNKMETKNCWQELEMYEPLNKDFVFV